MKRAPRGAFFHCTSWASSPKIAMEASTLIAERSASRLHRSLWSRDLTLPFEPWQVLWALALAAPWLLPTHMIPWRAFHADLLMALALLPAALWAMLLRRESVALPLPALAALGVACVPLLQWAGGMFIFAGDAWIAAVYLFGFALAIATGARLQQVVPGRLIDALFAAFAIAGLASVGIVLAQWLRVWPVRLADFDFIIYYPGSPYRPFGNLGQANHLATLLVWAMLALWWAYLAGRVRGAVAAAACAFVLVGITATQSRTAWLELVALAVAAVVWRQPLATRRCAPALAGLALLAVALVAGWGLANRALDLEAARALSNEVSSAGLRPAIWQLFIDSALQRPWAGWGWNQVPFAQATVALDHPSLHYTFQSAHNLMLDLMVQSGLPLGLLISLGLAGWMLVQARRVGSTAGCLLWLALAMLGVHAMLEFPQAYAYFLLPAGLMIGALEAMHPWRPVLVSRWLPTGALMLAAALTAWVGVEYHRAEQNLTQLRFERARIVPVGVDHVTPTQAPDLVLLTQLRDFLRALRLRPDAGMSAEQLELMRRVTLQYPSDGNHLILAAMEALNTGPGEAGRVLDRMCRMVPPPRCRDALAAWRGMAATSAPLAEVKLPAVPQ
ncbi:MAG: hypothetical protein F9K36_00685 [Burkholderiaceae bacterium]|nr:MAG: hypothetical protein F9K36_00685 [Burkholderiaceae bacterium]